MAVVLRDRVDFHNFIPFARATALRAGAEVPAFCLASDFVCERCRYIWLQQACRRWRSAGRPCAYSPTRAAQSLDAKLPRYRRRCQANRAAHRSAQSGAPASADLDPEPQQAGEKRSERSQTASRRSGASGAYAEIREDSAHRRDVI